MKNIIYKKRVIASMLLILLFILIATSIYAAPNPIITEYININANEFLNDTKTNLLEPGNMLTSKLEVINKTSVTISYEVYLDNLEGKLADKLFFYVFQDEELLYTNIAKDFTKLTPFKPSPLLGQNTQVFYIAIAVIDSENLEYFQGEYLNFDIIIHPYKA